MIGSGWSISRVMSSTLVAGEIGPLRRARWSERSTFSGAAASSTGMGSGRPSGARSGGRPTSVGLSTRSGSPAAAAPTDSTIAAWLRSRVATAPEEGIRTGNRSRVTPRSHVVLLIGATFLLPGGAPPDSGYSTAAGADAERLTLADLVDAG